MYAKYIDELCYPEKNKCCQRVIDTIENSKYCFECGRRLSRYQFDKNDFMEFVTSLHGRTCDSYGDAECTESCELTWWPFSIGSFIGAPRNEVAFLAEDAQVILLKALLDAKPELKSSEEDDFVNLDWENFKNNIHPSYR